MATSAREDAPAITLRARGCIGKHAEHRAGTRQASTTNKANMPAELSGAALGADELTERADEQQHTEQPPELPDELKKLQADIEKHAAQLIDSTQTEYNNFCHMSSQLDGCLPPPSTAPVHPAGS